MGTGVATTVVEIEELHGIVGIGGTLEQRAAIGKVAVADFKIHINARDIGAEPEAGLAGQTVDPVELGGDTTDRAGLERHTERIGGYKRIIEHGGPLLIPIRIAGV